MPQFGPGDGSETVLLGCLVKEHLRLWRSDGRAECVRLTHPSALRALLARGLVPRASVDSAHFREVGRLNGSGVLTIEKRQFPVEVCEEPAVSDDLWTEAADLFRDAATDAFARGEYLVVEPGGWEPVSEPYTVAGAKKAPGQWLLRVEAVPAPHAPSWPEPPEGHSGWGVAATADAEALDGIGTLIAEAAAMWARSPLDVVLTYGRQPDGPWSVADGAPAEAEPVVGIAPVAVAAPEPPAPAKAKAKKKQREPVAAPDSGSPAIDGLLREMRTDIEQLHSTRELAHARVFSALASTRFNHNTYPVFFTGDLQSRLVLVHPNPRQPENAAAEYEGEFEYADFEEYLDRHRRFGYHRWEIGDEHPSPIEYKQMRFLRHWGVIDFNGDADRNEPVDVARAFDQRLQLELIPYGSPKFPAAALSAEVIEPHYQRLMRVITAYPRDYVLLCGAAFDTLFAPHITQRDDHAFKLPTSTGTSRTKYRFANLLLDFDGGAVPVGLAPNFASLGVPMGAYGQTCHELYRDLRS